MCHHNNNYLNTDFLLNLFLLCYWLVGNARLVGELPFAILHSISVELGLIESRRIRIGANGVAVSGIAIWSALKPPCRLIP